MATGNQITRRWAAALAVLPLLFPWIGCASTQSTGPRSGTQTAEEMEGIRSHQEGTLTVKMFDLFHTGRPDVWEYYETLTDPATGQTHLRLVRKELDLNDDGRVDVIRYYDENDRVVKEELDLDFDGKIEEVIYFDDRGTPSRKEMLGPDGKPRLWKYYENGKLAREERISKTTGKVESWEYWVDGKLDRIFVVSDDASGGVLKEWQLKREK
jgi:hypothetical protein